MCIKHIMNKVTEHHGELIIVLVKSYLTKNAFNFFNATLYITLKSYEMENSTRIKATINKLMSVSILLIGFCRTALFGCCETVVGSRTG